MVVCSMRDFKIAISQVVQKIKLCAAWVAVQNFQGVELAQVGIASSGKRTKVAPMTVSSPNVIEIKLERLIDDMRLL